MKILHHPHRDDIHLSSVLYALSDPIRLGIISVLAQTGEQPCNYFCVPVAKSTLSHHIRTLREAGVVFVRIQGTQHFVTIRRADMDTRFPGLLDAVLGAASDAADFSADPSSPSDGVT
ncbi:ArsR/SmtB family transcription factor [Paenibacillus rigui]|uniref:Transcriptional regulator n=1 Tax=Paenibacillus rigui TaxID=554312 RepID=A0A229UJQ8_9BACL|nr:helix-turn-helix transcriptional regulator [Paenibacillus rigui]OXM83633.1 transcriptional regulator [Paenibacillus rigui]